MRKIRANAIAILTVAWILGTFYYLWQDNRAHAASSGGRGAQKAGGRPEQLREDRTIPLIVSPLCAPGQPAGEPRRASWPRAAAEGVGLGRGRCARRALLALYMLEHSCMLLWQPPPGQRGQGARMEGG